LGVACFPGADLGVEGIDTAGLNSDQHLIAGGFGAGQIDFAELSIGLLDDIGLHGALFLTAGQLLESRLAALDAAAILPARRVPASASDLWQRISFDGVRWLASVLLTGPSMQYAFSGAAFLSCRVTERAKGSRVLIHFSFGLLPDSRRLS
jgi:hypothetical protein